MARISVRQGTQRTIVLTTPDITGATDVVVGLVRPGSDAELTLSLGSGVVQDSGTQCTVTLEDGATEALDVGVYEVQADVVGGDGVRQELRWTEVDGAADTVLEIEITRSGIIGG